MKDVADDLALIVRNAIAYIKELERQVNELKREAEPVQEHKPLTTEEVEQLWAQSSWQGRANIGFARAIEKAHGIGI